MAVWLILFSLFLSAALKFFLNHLSHSKTNNINKLNLPPGPPTVPIFGNLFLLTKYLSTFGSFLHDLRHNFGPILTLRIGSSPSIFIASHSLAHQALIQNGAAFAYRPGPVTPGRILNSNHHDIGSSSDTRWRLLRRNITSEILTPSRYKSFGDSRKWTLEIIHERLKFHVESREPVPVMDHFRYAMFCLLLFMCFGEKLEEKVIKDIEDMERTLMSNYLRFNVFTLFPKFGKFIFRKRWLQLLDMRRRQESVLIPPIEARRERREKIKQENPDEYIACYVDSLFDLEITDEGGRKKLTNEEIVTLVSEFLDSGTDTTSTVLQWIMAHLVQDQDIQEKLYCEIKGVVGSGEEIREEDLQKISFLKAVVLETLRLHPPGYCVLPHIVREDIVLDGYVIPKNAHVNFMVAEMGRDPNVWKDPMEFKPERFLGDEGEAFDVTGSKEIKMMPFGAGRRICPALGLGTLHLQYFVATLVKDLKWTAVDREDVDMSEMEGFNIVMKNPLRAHVSPRVK